MSGATPRHIDSHDALRALMAAVTDVPVEWARADDYAAGHYCERCQADYDCPRTPGEHETCPTVCADCRERDGFTCAGCRAELPDAETSGELCAACEETACRDDRDERAYREAQS